MITKLTEELRAALRTSPGQPIEIEDEQTQNVYVMLDAKLFYQLVQQEHIASIARGITEMEAGQGRPVEEADAAMREKLGFSSKDA